jgi:hypothetical protein
MIKAILTTMLGLVVLAIGLLALVHPVFFIGVLAIGTAYWIGKSILE